MRFLIQRVSRAAVSTDNLVKGRIDKGLVVLIGIANHDSTAQADVLVDKSVHLRIFTDEAGKMNRSALDVGAGLLLVSQFTLYGNTKRGRRPSFDEAAPAELARPIYDYIVERAAQTGLIVQTGTFQADMQVELVNDGPVTMMLEA